MQLSSPLEVIEYWFGETIGGSLESIQDRMRLWFFRSSPEFDEIQIANKYLINDLANPTFAGWDVEGDPRALMALVIVLDQFSRSVYRGSELAFANDEICADLITKYALAVRSQHYTVNSECSAFENTWFLDVYSPIERFFLCVALQHSEKLENQEMGIKMARFVGYQATEDIQQYFGTLKGFPMEHYEVIRRFGRFPHRNTQLGRETTEEEQSWLDSDECPGWAKSQDPKATRSMK